MADPTISVVLTDANNRPCANLTGLRWAWWDEPVVSDQAAPALSGTGASTNASGVFSVTELAGSTLTDGEVGWLEVTDSDGTATQAPVAHVAAGPIAVSVAASSYVGPLDIVVGATAAYGVRALTADWLGENLFRLRRDSDDAELDFAADATTGEAPVADITTWLGGSDGFLVTLFDQSGSGIDLSEPTEGFQYQWSDSVQGGKPGFVVPSGFSVRVINDVEFITLSTGGATVFSVAGNTFRLFAESGSSDYITAVAGPTTAIDFYEDATGNEAGGELATGITSVSLLDAAWAFGSKNLQIDGAEQAFDSDLDAGGALGAVTFDSVLMLQSTSDPGQFCEIILYDGVKSSGDRTLVRENIADYYGITLGGGEELGGFTTGFDGGFA